MSEQTDTAAPGIPVGGIGTGGIEFGPDGCFRNVTVNNNRWADEQIPLWGNAFMAVRAATPGGDAAVKLLQTQSTLPWDDAGLEAPLLTADALRFEALYPAAIYRLAPPAFPLEVRWEMRSILIPYDSQASSLPLIVATVRFRNPTRAAVEAAALWNWENINGCTAEAAPEARGPIRPMKLPDAPLTEEEEPPAMAWGLLFGELGRPKTNAHGSYYLAGVSEPTQHTSVMAWDAAKPAEFQAFWKAFADEGRLGNLISRNPNARMGSVCARTKVPPEGEATVRMLFAWHCPRFVVDDANHGNFYASFTEHAPGVAEHMLRHKDYFLKGAVGWQDSLLRSSLPAWLTRAMLNSLRVLTSNTLFGQDQQFARIESPGADGVGRVDRSFHGSLPIMLLYPELEEKELLLFAREGKFSGDGGVIVGQIGLRGFGDGAADRTPPPETLPLVLLLACRNAMWTGRRVPLETLWPLLRRMLEESGAFSKASGDLEAGVTEGHSSLAPWISDRATAWLSGLWVAGLHAAAVLARHLGHPKDAEALEVRLGEWLTLFDEELWDEKAGHYRLHTGKGDTAHVCHEGQLAGQWYADFLCFGRLFDLERVQRSLAAIRKKNERPDGVRQAGIDPDSEWPYSHRFPPPGMTWPAHALTQYVCTLVYNGDVDQALAVTRRILEGIQQGEPVVWPMRYDLDKKVPVGAESNRHVSGPAIWHLYAAITGFLLDNLNQTIWVRPRLPAGITQLSVPLFSPLCMGWLSWREQQGGRYLQEVKLRFDSPVRCESLLIRVPDNTMKLQAHLEANIGTQAVTMRPTSDGRDDLLRIALPSVAASTETINLTIRQV